MKKFDLVIPTMQPNIEVGSQVVFIDGSYTLSLQEGKLEHQPLGLSQDIFEVIAINVVCPSESSSDALRYANNCIAYNKENNSYHFCSSINIRSIKELGDDKPYTLKNK